MTPTARRSARVLVIDPDGCVLLLRGFDPARPERGDWWFTPGGGVDPGESRELYRHLKLRGAAPVRLVHYPGEGHGNRKAAARYDYSLRSLRWLEHYLKGPGGAMPPFEIEYQPGEPEAEPERAAEAAAEPELSSTGS